MQATVHVVGLSSTLEAKHCVVNRYGSLCRGSCHEKGYPMMHTESYNQRYLTVLYSIRVGYHSTTTVLYLVYLEYGSRIRTAVADNQQLLQLTSTQASSDAC